MRRYRLQTIALLLLTSGHPVRSQDRSLKSMPDPKVQPLLEEVSQWPEEQFFSSAEETQRRFEWELADARESGYWTAAPKSIALEKRGSLPVLLLAHYNALRQWEVSEEANAIFVVSVLSGDPIPPCFAFPSTKRWAPGEWGSRQGPPPKPDVQKVFTSQMRTLNARQLCNIPWQAGRVAMTYISYDWRSSTLITELTGPSVAARPIPAGRAAEYRRSLFPEKLVVGKFPSYAASTYHPEVAGQGVALRIPSRIDGSSKIIPALGKVRIPLPAHTLVGGSDADLPAALVPAEIVILELDNPHRGIIPFSVPFYAKAGQQLHAGDVAEAYFAVNLFPQIQPGLSPGEYICYLAVQEYIAGPVKIVVE